MTYLNLQAFEGGVGEVVGLELLQMRVASGPKRNSTYPRHRLGYYRTLECLVAGAAPHIS